MGTEIKIQDIQQLLDHFSKCLYKAKETDTKSEDIMQRCLQLVSLDYSHVVISNSGGELSANYPSKLIILEYERSTVSRPSEPPRTTGTIYENMHDATKLRDLFGKSRSARCRARFPLPVILFRGKHICRSATLSGGPEIYGRSGLDYLFSVNENNTEEDEEMLGAAQTQRDWQLFDRVRSQDIRLLKTLNVGTIIDFMVEKKKVKFGMNVTSSEKVDKENRYSEFTIVSLPYPGCEFFKEYRDNDYVAKGLVFDWSQSHVDAVIGVPDDPISSQLKIDWEKYKVWDLVKLTQNYMKLLLRYLQESSTGLLVHCISGWDRTPLFISLLRLSLWADGTIHQSLNASQILYFTIAYDWMLFGHNLMDRLSKGEDIFFFCFYFLKHLVGDEFSVAGRCCKTKQQTTGSSSGSGSSIGNAAAVLRNDPDLHLDGMLFDADCAISSRGSNISLNSSCSSISSKSQDNPPIFFHNVPDLSDEHANGNLPAYYNSHTTWPPIIHSVNESSPSPLSALSSVCSAGPRSPHTTRTSPVAVPVSSRIRQRNDSNSSLSVGSWQLISGTGSLRGSASASTSATPNSVQSQSSSNTSLCEGQISTESSTTVIEDECFIYNSGPPDSFTMRRERLQTVRTLFYNAYCSTIGFKFKNGQDSGLGSLLGNFAEKNTKLGTELEYVIARKNPKNSRHANLELRGSPLFSIKQSLASLETVNGTVVLSGELDFETQAMTCCLCSLWTLTPSRRTTCVTLRASHWLTSLAVLDVQDMPPVFTRVPPVTLLNNTLKEGDVILTVHAEDGDKGFPRQIRYGLVSKNHPFTPFFHMDDKTGNLSLARPLKNLRLITSPHQPILLTIIAEEVKTGLYEPLAMSTTVQLALIMGELDNTPPYFENDNYVAHIEENSPQGTALLFGNPYITEIRDDDLGKNGVFKISLENDNGTFEISPQVAEKRTNFVICVCNNILLDYEKRQSVIFTIVAQEICPKGHLSSSAQVTVYLKDVNDNPPVFREQVYRASLPENVTAGFLVTTVHATDADSGVFAEVAYTRIYGNLNDSLSIDARTGEIKVQSNRHGFDREYAKEYQFYVEAADMSGDGNKATVPLVIQVDDVNDNIPRFEKVEYVFVLSKDLLSLTESPAIVRAIDDNAEPPNNVVRYEILDGNRGNLFSLNPTTGLLTVINRAYSNKLRRNDEPLQKFELNIRAYDSGGTEDGDGSAYCSRRVESTV